MELSPNPYQQMLAEGRKSLRPEDIKAYGVQRFLDEQAQREPFPALAIEFTEEEDRIMDEILAEEGLPTDESEVNEE
jgi:hypothetical protein